MAKSRLLAVWLLMASFLLMKVETTETGIHLPMECDPDVKQRCQATDEKNKFLVNGHVHIVKYKRPDFIASCKAAEIDDDAWPRFPTMQTISLVTLDGCAPPANISYKQALRNLKIDAHMFLKLTGLRSDMKISAPALADSPAYLTLIAANESLDLEPGALTNVSLETLHLQGVRADRLPQLHGLTMIHTEIKELPPGALDAMDIQIEEKHLKSLSGLAPRLTTLRLSAPVQTLPHAPRLKTLILGADTTEEFPHDFLTPVMSNLETLHMTGLRARTLPADFLHGGWSLRSFTAMNGSLTTLPPGLFSQTPKLLSIEINDHKLESLPRGLFSELPTLVILSLEGNRLKAIDIKVIGLTPLPMLRRLSLARNPLGDLCVQGGASPLQSFRRLRTLNLAITELTHICSDWARDMEHIEWLFLNKNAIRNVSSADLRMRRSGDKMSMNFLSDNPIEYVNCSQEDFRRVPENQKKKQVNVFLESPLKCDCGLYWLSRIQQKDSASVQILYKETPSLHELPTLIEHCTNDWRPCMETNGTTNEISPSFQPTSAITI